MGLTVVLTVSYQKKKMWFHAIKDNINNELTPIVG